MNLSVRIVLLITAILTLSVAVYLKSTHKKSDLLLLSGSSFASTYGPGPELVRLFEAECQCKVSLLSFEGSAVLLEKMKWLKGQERPDVVIGLDEAELASARQALQWKNIQVDTENFEAEIKTKVYPDFIPYDWAPLTLIYRQGEIIPPQRVEDLLEQRFAGTLSLPDPRFSSPGKKFLDWAVESAVGDPQAVVKGLPPAVKIISPSWSSAYGFFKSGKAKLTWSYVTSIAYHLSKENAQNYRACEFSSGHPVQIEFAGVPADCTNCDRAHDFLKFLLSKTAQKIIMNKNFMFPVVTEVKAGTVFDTLPKLKIRLLNAADDKWLDLWKEAFRVHGN